MGLFYKIEKKIKKAKFNYKKNTTPIFYFLYRHGAGCYLLIQNWATSNIWDINVPHIESS